MMKFWFLPHSGYGFFWKCVSASKSAIIRQTKRVEVIKQRYRDNIYSLSFAALSFLSLFAKLWRLEKAILDSKERLCSWVRPTGTAKAENIWKKVSKIWYESHYDQFFIIKNQICTFNWSKLHGMKKITPLKFKQLPPFLLFDVIDATLWIWIAR